MDLIQNVPNVSITVKQICSIKCAMKAALQVTILKMKHAKGANSHVWSVILGESALHVSTPQFTLMIYVFLNLHSLTFAQL